MKGVKIVLTFIISTIVIYLILTISAFYSKCNEYQLFVNGDRILEELDSSKIQGLGKSIELYKQALEDSLKDENEDNHSLAEHYDPLGFSIWSFLQLEVKHIVRSYVWISILSGSAITIAYTVITSKKMNNILKIVIGYLGVMLIVPPIYKYTYTFRFWDIISTYTKDRLMIYFYIGYTIIFALIYIINYKIGVKMTKELNKTIENIKN